MLNEGWHPISRLPLGSRNQVLKLDEKTHFFMKTAEHGDD